MSYIQSLYHIIIRTKYSESFKDEYRRLIVENGIEIDERRFLTD